ncbi:MAG: glycosyltransferase family 4 protein [Candidatus Helarchaeota archaeon]
MIEIIIIGPPLISIPSLKGGGIEKYIFSLGEQLSKLGYNITIFTINNINNKDTLQIINEYFKIRKISVPRIYLIRGFIYNIKIFFNLIRNKNHKIIWINGISQIIVVLMLKLISKKISNVFTVHNLRPWYKISGHSIPRNIIDYILGFITLRFSNYIITFTEKLKKYIKLHFTCKGEFKVLPPGISQQVVEKYPLKSFTKLRQKNVFQIVFIGRIEKNKGLEYLILSLSDIIKKYSHKFHIILKIIGPINRYYGTIYKKGLNNKKCFNKYLIRLKELIDKYELNENVSFKGELESYRVLDILYESDLFILPTMGDTFNLSVLEALAVGIPIIITKYTGIIEYLDIEKYGYTIDRIDHKLLSKAIELVLLNPEHNEILKKNSKQIVLNKFIWNVLIKKYNNLIQEISEKIKSK